MHNKMTGIERSKCPKCGYRSLKSTGNMVSYPEHFERWHCGGCGFLMKVSDNGIEASCYDFEDFVICI